MSVNLGKAHVADKAAALPLEATIEIKAMVSVRGQYDLPKELLTKINDKAKTILEEKSNEITD